MTLKGALRLSRNDPAALRPYSVGDLLDYQRLQDVIKPKELGLPEDIEIALLEEAKTNNDVEYPLEYDCMFYKEKSQILNKLFFILSNSYFLFFFEFSISRFLKAILRE